MCKVRQVAADLQGRRQGRYSQVRQEGKIDEAWRGLGVLLRGQREADRLQMAEGGSRLERGHNEADWRLRLHRPADEDHPAARALTGEREVLY